MKDFEEHPGGNPGWLKVWPILGYLDMPERNPLKVTTKVNSLTALNRDEVRLFGDLLMSVLKDSDCEPTVYGQLGPIEANYVRGFACPVLDLEMDVAQGVGFALKSDLQRAHFIQLMRKYIYLQCKYKAAGMVNLAVSPSFDLISLQMLADEMQGPMLRFGFSYMDFSSAMIVGWPQIFDNAYMQRDGRSLGLYQDPVEAFELPTLAASLVRRRESLATPHKLVSAKPLVVLETRANLGGHLPGEAEDDNSA